MPLTLDHSYARDLKGLYVPWQGQDWPDPQIVLRNDALARRLGLDVAALDAGLLTGHALPATARPLAMAYAGHQFGGFSRNWATGARSCWARLWTVTARAGIST